MDHPLPSVRLTGVHAEVLYNIIKFRKYREEEMPTARELSEILGVEKVSAMSARLVRLKKWHYLVEDPEALTAREKWVPNEDRIPTKDYSAKALVKLESMSREPDEVDKVDFKRIICEDDSITDINNDEDFHEFLTWAIRDDYIAKDMNFDKYIRTGKRFRLMKDYIVLLANLAADK